MEEDDEEDEEVTDQQIRDALAAIPRAVRKRLGRKTSVRLTGNLLKGVARSDA